MRNRRDIVASVLLILLGTGVSIESIRLKVGTPLMPQPGFFPLLGGIFLVGLSVVLFFRAWLGLDDEARQAQESFGNLTRPAALVVSMGVYTALLEPVGYLLPTLAIAMVILRVLGVTSWKVIGVASVLLSVGTYVLFGRVLGIDLPPGILSFIG